MKDALLVIDVQNEYFTGSMPVTYPQGSFENILKAMDRAQAGSVPVIVIQHTNPAFMCSGLQERDGTLGTSQRD